MIILALEFSSAQRSVAVLSNNSQRMAFHEAVETGQGAMQPITMVQTVLGKAGLEREDVEVVAVGLGPGSYTGIRAGIALAQGWQLAAGVKLAGINSMECMAAQAYFDGVRGRAHLVVDAQRNELYWAEYDLSEDGPKPLSPLRLATPEQVREASLKGGTPLGPAVTRWFSQGRVLLPGASMLARIASQRAVFVRGNELEPIYLRPTAFVKAPPPRVLPDHWFHSSANR